MYAQLYDKYLAPTTCIYIYIYLVERTELVIGETCVTCVHSSLKSRDRGKKDAGTERERESNRTIEGGQNS
jgi:hypothetical protein